MTESVDDLVASIPSSQSGAGCWASRLEGRAAEFVAAVKAREEQGVKLNRGVIIEKLKSEFDVIIGEERLRYHLLGRCSCE